MSKHASYPIIPKSGAYPGGFEGPGPPGSLKGHKKGKGEEERKKEKEREKERKEGRQKGKR